MCEGSIHVANRDAKEKERLVLSSVKGTGYLLWYPTKKEKVSKAVCIRKPTEAIIAKVEFTSHLLKSWSSVKNDDVRFKAIAALHGKKNAPVTLNRHNQTAFKVDGREVMVHWNWLVPGTKVSIGYPMPKKRVRKVTGNKGMAVIAAALTEQNKLGRVKSARVLPRRVKT